jgi:hypothetical protein
MPSTPIIDIHVHSSLKPYSNSFYINTNRLSVTSPACIWFNDRSGRIDSIIEGIAGVPRYRQSDFDSLTVGQITTACISLYPIEKEFFEVKPNFLKRFEIMIANFASMLGKDRIRYVKDSNFNYFQDLKDEYDFLLCLNNEIPDDGSKKYKVVANGVEIEEVHQLKIIVTIEGGHVFCDGNDTQNPDNWQNIEQNIAEVKSWDFPPFFVAIAHHFYNGLCTHAKSFFDLTEDLLDQRYGMREYKLIPNDSIKPITDLGEKFIDLLLSEENGRRILIDVKHMSLEARKKYYEILKTDKYKNDEIPVIWSHGAVSFDYSEINLNLEIDVKTIYQTNGLIGIEIDQRILGYNKNRFWKTLRNIFRGKEKEAYLEAKYFWNQIIAIAEYAYNNGFDQNPWKCIALGSDYDGIINPLNNYRDATTMSKLYQNLLIYLEDYWKKPNSKIPKPVGKDAQDIIYEIMYKNAYEFIVKHY